MPRMAGPSAGAAKIQIPRWIQLVGLPILLLLLWVVAGAARHVVFLFLVAGTDRVPAQPDRAGPDPRLDSPGIRRRTGVPDVRRHRC